MNKEDIIKQAKKIQGWMSDGDLDALYDLAQKYVKEGGKVIEVGSWNGLSTYVLAQICKEKNARVFAVDTFAGAEDPNSYKNKPENVGSYHEAVADPGFMKIFKRNMEGLPVTVIRGDSQVMHTYFSDGDYDMVFLDGNHNHPVIDNDIKNYLPKVKKGGMFCGHDHGNKERPEGQPYGSDISEAVDNAFGTMSIGSYERWDLYSSPTVIRTQSSIWCHEV